MTHTYLEIKGGKVLCIMPQRSNMTQVASYNEQNLSFTKNMLLFEVIGS